MDNFRKSYGDDEGGVLVEHLLLHLVPGTAQAGVQLVVAQGDDLRGEDGGVCRAVDGYGGDGKAGGHLYGGQQRVQPVERGGFHGNADHRQHGARGERPGQVRGFAGGGDQHAEAVVLTIHREAGGLVGRAVRAEHMRLKRDSKGPELVEAGLQNGKIAVRAHDHGDFFHSAGISFPSSGAFRATPQEQPSL